MNSDVIKIVVGVALLGGAGIAGLVMLSDRRPTVAGAAASGVGYTGGAPGAAGTGGGAVRATSGDLILANKQDELRTSRQRLANATSLLANAQTQVGVARQRVQSIDLQVSQAQQQVSFAERQLTAARESYRRTVQYEHDVFPRMEAMGVQTQSQIPSANEKVLNAMRGVEEAKFRAGQQVQSLQLERSTTVAQLQNETRSAENAARDAENAKRDVTRIEREIQLMLTPVVGGGG